MTLDEARLMAPLRAWANLVDGSSARDLEASDHA